MTPTDSNADKHTLDEPTGIAALRSWRAVYIVVTIIFILWVLLLELLTRTFS